MFQTISWALFVIIFLGILVHMTVDLVKGNLKPKSFNKLHKFWWCGWSKNLSCLSKIKRILVVISIISLLVMFLTAFSGRLASDQLMSGYILMIHVGTAPLFILCVVMLLIMWGYQCRLNDKEWAQFLDLLRFKTTSSEKSLLIIKLTYWISMVLSLPVSLSMLISMFTLFGTHGQEVLFSIHQYASLALVSSSMVHVYLLLRHQCK